MVRQRVVSARGLEKSKGKKVNLTGNDNGYKRIVIKLIIAFVRMLWITLYLEFKGDAVSYLLKAVRISS